MKYFLKGLFLLFLIFLPNLLIYLVNGLCYFVFNLVHFVWHFKLYELNYKKCTNKIYLIFEKWYEDGDDNVEGLNVSPAIAKPMLAAAFTMYLNEDANGCTYVSKKPMNQTFYCTPARLKCVETKSKNITRKGVFAGAICETIDGRILKIVKVKNRQGYERSYIREGSL